MSTESKMPSQVCEGENHDLLLFAELKPRLSVVHTVLHIPEHRYKRIIDDASSCLYEKGTTVKVLKSHIEVIQRTDDAGDGGGGEERRTITLDHVSLIPASCHGLKWVPGDGMHFRMQICRRGEEVEENLPVPNCVKSKSTEERLAPYRAAPVIACHMCGQTVLQRSFSRVRALPSENWHEIADQMFCHPHEDDVPDTCRLLSPGSGDCFVGERHLVLREEDMSWRGAVRGSRGTVTCTRCHVVLGKIREFGRTSCVELSVHYLTVGDQIPEQLPRNNLSKLQRMEAWFADFLLTETNAHSSSRLLIEAETDSSKTSPYILLWVLESNVVLYSGRSSSSDKNRAMCLSPQPILKVLYRDCVRHQNKGLGKQWREDFTVHAVTLPHDLCRQMLLTLVDSSQLLPRSLRSANGFYVGFLRKTSP